MQKRYVLSGSVLVALFAATVPAYSALSNADKQFLMTAARVDMTEAHEGQMAQERATNTDVKDFAKTLVNDHTKDYEQLTALAAKTGVSIPTGINAAKIPVIEQLDRVKGVNFDRQFAKDEVADHQRALALYKRESEHAQNPDVKAYAANMLPILEKHLHLAEQANKPVKRT